MGTKFQAAVGLSHGHLGARPGLRHAAGRSKYGAKRAESFDGRSFASQAERDRYHVLLDWQAQGKISNLELQPIYHFTINGISLRAGRQVARYTGDFRYRDAAGGLVVEDVKGVITRDFHLRVGLMLCVHGIVVQLVSKSRSPRKTRA